MTFAALRPNAGPEKPAPPPARAHYEEVYAIALAEARSILPAAVGEGHPLVRRAGLATVAVPASRLARSLVALDDALAVGSLREAALARLRHYRVRGHLVSTDSAAGLGSAAAPLEAGPASLPASGPLLVLSNHPGCYDALLLFAAVGRDDLRVLAARRPLFTALPNLAARLLALDPGASAGVAVKKAYRHLRDGGALLHFPAGRIEPDPRVARPGTPLLAPWKPGLDTLLAAAGRAGLPLAVVPAVVSGVLCRRAMGLARALGRDGQTDPLVPLLELTFPAAFGDLDARVRFGPVAGAPGAEASAAALRGALEVLAGEAQREALAAGPGRP